MIRSITRATLCALVLLTAACSSGSKSAELVLDGSPRHPDDQGVATEADRTHILLDGKRSYKVSPALQSFSTYNMQTIPLVTRVGQYVQVGLKGKTVIWIAGIAAVVPSTPPRVFYVGELKKVDGKDAIFVDGTVLRLADNVRSKAKPGTLTALIDPMKHEVVELRGGR